MQVKFVIYDVDQEDVDAIQAQIDEAGYLYDVAVSGE